MILKSATPYSRKFFMVSNSDHISGKTGLTGAVTVYLTKGPGAAATLATNSGTNVVELDSTHAPGWYQILLSATDTSVTGDLTFSCTGSGADPTDFVDQIQGQVFTDLVINGSGRVQIASGVQQNQSLTIMFPMTIQGVPTPGLTVTGQRNFGSGFSLIAGTITDLGSGDYKATLLAADTNSAAALYRFIAASADDRNIALQFDP